MLGTCGQFIELYMINGWVLCST